MRRNIKRATRRRKLWTTSRSKAVAMVAAALTVTSVSVLSAAPASADPSCPNNDPKFGFCVGGKILEEFNETGGWPFFGNATNYEADAANYGRWQPFEKNSSIYWHANVSNGHANQIGGLIRDKWGAMGWEGGSDLGYPVTRELGTPTKPGRYNHFEGGSIYWSQPTGAWPVWGAIRDQWANAGWENSNFGFPSSDEYNCWDGINPDNKNWIYGGKGQNFQNGRLFWNSAPNNFTNSYSSVHGSPRTLKYSSTTKYTSAFNSSVSTWNGLGRVAISQAPVLNNEVLVVRDVNRSDYSWAGHYENRGTDYSTLEMNDAKFSGPSDARIQPVMLHEMGHSLGLAHSCAGSNMDERIYFTKTSTLSDLDKSSYNTKHP